MKKVTVDSMDLVYKVCGNRVFFTIESKIKITEKYNTFPNAWNNFDLVSPKMDFVNRIVKAVPEIKIQPDAFRVLVNKWVRFYKEGKLTTTNTFSINHQATKKVTITLDSKINDTELTILKLQKELDILRKAKELMAS